MAKQKIIKQVFAIDVSKDQLAECYMIMSESYKSKIQFTKKKHANSVKGIEQMFANLEKNRVDKDLELIVIMEATGVYHEELAYMAYERGYSVKIVSGQHMHRFAKSVKYKLKTDKIDAKIIAQYGMERGDMEPNWTPPSDFFRNIKRLSRERGTLQKDITRQRNRLKALLAAKDTEVKTIERSKSIIAFLEQQVEEVEDQLNKMVKKDKSFKQDVDLVSTINGVGFITAVTVLAETDCFQNFNSMGQVVSYAGYDVIYKQSGSSVNTSGHISKKGNSRIRAILFMAAWSAVKYNPVFKNLKQRVESRTGISNKGYVAVQRKLLTLMYTLVKRQENYDLNKHMQQCLEAQNKKMPAVAVR
jgi:transposase